MTDLSLGGERAGTSARSASSLYRAVWRWHFYAGLLVLPFMILLALTGALYLFHTEIDGVIHADLKRVEVRAGVPTISPSAMVAAALAAHPGTAIRYTTPGDPGASAEITVETPAHETLAVYVDPHTGRVLGTLPDRGTVMWVVRQLHSLTYLGGFGQALIELAAGWSILLVGTGIYLWWPRRRRGGVVSVRGRPGHRVFWRDLHAVTGLFVGVFMVFLAATGMPWSVLWGSTVNGWLNASNYGYPAGVRVEVPMSHHHLTEHGQTAWSLEQARMPHSSGGMRNPSPIGLDKAVATFDRLGLHPGYAVSIPATPGGVYTGSAYPRDVHQQRLGHLDQYSGKSLIDMGYADYGPLAKGIEWGISVHQGHQFGRANQLVLLAACLAIVALAVSAGVMWWKRRPSGSLGVPPLPSDRRTGIGLLAILGLGGIVFPLVGVSFAAMLVLDSLYVRSLRAREA